LSAAEREEIRKIQINVIASLHRPPKNYALLNVCEEISILYLKEFESLDQPYGEGDDIAVTFHLICRGSGPPRFFCREVTRPTTKLDRISIGSRAGPALPALPGAR
jgi:hypothetical protein